jgi:hypothetical protein
VTVPDAASAALARRLLRDPVPYQREAEEILADWRAAERDLLAAAGDSLESKALQAEIGRLRDEYQQLVEEAQARANTGLPPSPADRRRAS